jgi:ABC-2 type transport system ATP-binding protein
VDDDLTGRENLFILGLMHHLGRRGARARAAELLDRFGLADAADRLVKTWSGGMRRRLDLIASLVVAPPVLFLDEPTTGLDPRSRAEIWAAVRALAADGTTVLLTTQYLEEADRIADQIVIIDGGLVTAHGSPDELKDSLGRRVDVVLADAGDLDAAEAVLADIMTGPPRLEAGERRLTAPVAAGGVTLPDLARRLDAAGVTAEDVSIRRPSLDEVFWTARGLPRAPWSERGTAHERAERRAHRRGRGRRAGAHQAQARPDRDRADPGRAGDHGGPLRLHLRQRHHRARR